MAPLEIRHRSVRPISAKHAQASRFLQQSPLKSVGAERTFDSDLTEEADLLIAFEPVIDAAWTRIARAGASGRTLTLKAKFADFRSVARSKTLAAPMFDRLLVAETGRSLLRSILPADQGIRLLGLTLSGLSCETAGNDPEQPPLNFEGDGDSTFLATPLVPIGSGP
jgi:nucleotidyltransferase/DNA polymerase involved in DNA repair